MNRFLLLLAVFGALLINFQTAAAQERASGGGEEFTGSVISFNGPRTRTAFFTLRINKFTSDDEAAQNLATLRDDGQDKLLDRIRKEEVGRFSVGNDVGVAVNVARESIVDGKRRIFAVFERYQSFAELRGGYRSTDYPFGVIEIFLDPRTGKGEGTLISAARIRFDDDKKTNAQTVEIENFATYPAKLTAVTTSNKRRKL